MGAGGTLDLNGFGITVSGLNGNAGATITDNSTPTALTVNIASGSSTYAGVLVNAIALTKTGTGVLTLSGVNSYVGGTTISAGTLVLGNSLALQDSTLNTGGGILSFGGLTSATFGGLTGPGSLGLTNSASGGVALSVGNNNQSTTYSGVLTGGGGLTKIGTGVLTLGGADTYAGNTVISAGTLVLGNSLALQQSTVDTSGGGVLSFGALTSATFGGLTGPGSLSLTNSASGGVALSVGNNNRSTTYSGVLAGGGGLTKIGTGVLLLSGTDTYSGSTTVTGGTLQLGNSAALGSGGLAVGAGGTLDLNGFGVTLPTVSGSAGATITDNSTPAAPPIPTALVADIASGSSTYAGAITKGANGQDIALTKIGNGTLVLSGTSNYTGGTTINQGTLNVTGALLGGGPVVLANGTTLGGSGTVKGNISGPAASTILASGNLTLGDSTSYSGFFYSGTLAVGGNNVTLNDAAFANLGVLTTISGGTLTAPNGVSLGVGCNLVGSGVVNGKIAAGYGSTINATGNMTLGSATTPVGFTSNGELYTNNNVVTINDSNQAVLGSLTQLGTGTSSGTLNAPNGIVVDTGMNLVGQGVVNTTNSPSKATIINGTVEATGSGMTYTGYVEGTGTYEGPVTFEGTYSPGVATASVQLEDLLLTPTSTLLMDIGGMTPGSQYDVVNLSDEAALGGTLEVNLVNGFTPSVGDSFEIINGTTTGSFGGFSLPALPNGMRWSTSELYSDGMVSVVPEPSTLALLFIGTVGLMAWAWRRKRVSRA